MKKLIMIRPPLFTEQGTLTIRGKNQMAIMFGILHKELDDNAMFLSSFKEIANKTAKILAKGFKKEVTCLKELISGDFRYYITSVIYETVVKAAEGKDTLVIVTGKDVCYDLPMYWANFEKTDASFLKRNLPETMPRGGIAVIELEKQRVDVSLYS